MISKEGIFSISDIYVCMIFNANSLGRVAGAFFADFHIPGDLTHLWKYMKLMYSLDAFIQSVPADQVIYHSTIIWATISIFTTNS